jgi:predicted DNA binding CopG/RHH family protein
MMTTKPLKEENSPTLVRINFAVPEELRRRFKSKIAREGKSAQAILSALVEKYIKDEVKI